MARLCLLMLLCGACCPQSLSFSVGFIGTPQQCEKARFVPGYNLGGEGFDIVTMERKGAYVIDTETWSANGTCRLFRNTYMNGAIQKIPVAVEDWRILSECSTRVSSTVYDSAESLVNESTSSVSNDWKIGLDIPVNPLVTLGVGFGGSHSRESAFAIQKSKQDHYTFMSHSVHCSSYRYRMKANPPLSQDFKSAVTSLPPCSPKAESSYRRIIDTFGTHFITQVTLGGEIKAVTSVRTCEASMNGFSTSEVNDCLSAEASASFAKSAKIETMMKHCQGLKKKLGHSPSFSTRFNERYTKVIGGDVNEADFLFEEQSQPSVYKNWISSLKTTPDVVRYNLQPLHTLLPANHYARIGLKEAIEVYVKKNAVFRKCSESCKIGHRSNRRDPCACVCESSQNIRSNCCPAGKGLAILTVFGLAGRKLYGDTWGQTDGSVEVKYGDQTKRTDIISNNDNPTWPGKFEFGAITINMVNKLTFSVYDQDTYWNSDLLGKCSFELRRGRVNDICDLKHGTLFFSYNVECAGGLSGTQCQEYTSSPMSASLAKVFYTRNSVLGEEMGKNEKV